MKFFGNLFVFFFALMFTSVFSQDLKLYEFELLIEKANGLNAELLSPANYQKGILYYEDIKKNIILGKPDTEVAVQVKYALESLNKAIEVSEKAIQIFEKVLKERELAEKFNTKNYSNALWERAEHSFKAASLSFESGEIKDPNDEINNVVKQYEEAEIDAAKNFYVPEIKKNIKSAEDNDIDDYAPTTLTNVKQLLALIEQELKKSPIRADFVRDNSFKAYQEVRHAIYIGNLIASNKKNRKETEDLIIEYEKPLKKFQDLLGIQDVIEKGIESYIDEVSTHIEKFKKEIKELKTENKKLKENIVEVNNNYIATKNELVTLQTEKAKLDEIVGKVEKDKELFESVKNKFSPSEATVLQVSENIIIRLIGLSFASGKSNIEPEYFNMLTRVTEVINLFPKAKITVEGHTDSQGNATQNQQISEQRAFAVFQYIITNLKISKDHLLYVGYGADKPIASNTTKEGREQNRRIDIVIEPNFYK